jgi:hypothetical protein
MRVLMSRADPTGEWGCNSEGTVCQRRTLNGVHVQSKRDERPMTYIFSGYTLTHGVDCALHRPWDSIRCWRWHPRVSSRDSCGPNTRYECYSWFGRCRECSQRSRRSTPSSMWWWPAHSSLIECGASCLRCVRHLHDRSAVHVK